MIWFFAPIATLAVLYFVAVALMELEQAWHERKRANDRYVCKVTGEAWERANRKD